MGTRSVTVRLPEDLVEFVGSCPGENFSDKLIRLLRNISKKGGYMDLSVARFYRDGMTFEEYFVNRYGHSPEDYCVILQHTGLSTSKCQAFLTWEIGTFQRLKEQFQQTAIFCEGKDHV